jgi:hypothetical protein
MNAQLHTELWWQPADYLHFKSSAKQDVEMVMKERNLDLKASMALLFSPSATSPPSNASPPFPSQSQQTEVISPTAVARRPSIGTLSISADATKGINFLEIRGKPSHLINDEKPIHPLAFLA